MQYLRFKNLPGFQAPLAYISLFCLFLITRFVLNGLLKGWEPGLYSDASAHYVSGVMVQEYISSAFGTNPFVYIAEFHEKYPFVAVGLWPPFFHMVEGAWMALFNSSRFSIIIFDAWIVGLACCAMFHYASKLLNYWHALLAALTLCLTYQFLASLEILLIDVLTALLIFVSTMQFAAFMRNPTLKKALWVSSIAILALLSKGTAFSLALVIPLCLLFTKKLHLLKEKWLWVIPSLIILVAGPWYFLTSGYSSQGFRYQWGIDYFLQAMPAYSGYIFSNVGALTLFFAVVGAWATLKEDREDEFNDIWCSLIALIAGVFIFQIIMPVALQERYIIALYFPMILLAFKGVKYFVSKYIPAIPYILVILTSNALLLSINHSQPYEKGGAKIISVVEAVMPANGTPLLLIASPEIEGVLATEVLMNMTGAKRRNTFLIRGVKLLGAGGYNNHDYIPRYTSIVQVADAIDKTGVSFILKETSERTKIWLHNMQVTELMKKHPDRYRVIKKMQISPERSIELIQVLTARKGPVDLRLIKETNRNKVYEHFKNKFG